MKRLFFALFFTLFLFSCVNQESSIKCFTYLDCEPNQSCVDGICIANKTNSNDDYQTGTQPDENAQNKSDYDRVADSTDQEEIPDQNSDKNSDENGYEGGGDLSENEKPDEEGSQVVGSCSDDLDCDDQNDCTDDKCDSGYCFNTLKIEICNGIDDNCNGQIDESFEGMNENCDTGLTGICATGQKVCLNGEIVCRNHNFDVVETCNEIDDNCDGQIDNVLPENAPLCPLTLGICASSRQSCVDGVWQECDMGSYGENYSEIDELDDNFIDSNCDGIDGYVENFIFVDGAVGDDEINDGTIDAPLASITKALELSAISGIYSIVAAQGLYEEEIILPDQIKIYGGFNGNGDWGGSPENETIIFGGQKGVSGNGVSQILLKNLTITAADQTVPGNSSYGLFLSNANDVVLKNLAIIGGLGADGKSGDAGISGSNGGKGGNGSPGCEETNAPGGSHCDAPTVGSAGGNSSCYSARGGIGGASGHAENDGYNGAPGYVGVANGAGAGGKGGTLPMSGTVCNNLPAVRGQNGKNGSSGSAGSAIEGTFSETGFVAATGTAGMNGDFGKGGGGGGGKGGTTNYNSYGSSGGGGGAGGCGGTGGTGGQGGGGSFGIYAVNSALSLINCKIKTLGGGKGGNGGSGGNGGNGGNGGEGGAYGGSGEQDDGGCGGYGGKGGNGGNGGNGGSGVGGPTYGIYSINSTINFDEETSFDIGAGGTGGTNSGISAPSGPSGSIY